MPNRQNERQLAVPRYTSFLTGLDFKNKSPSHGESYNVMMASTTLAEKQKNA